MSKMEKAKGAQFPSREIVDSIRKEYPAGTRVRLVRMDDSQAPSIGTLGTMTGVDDIGSLLVKWDNGSGLHVVYGEDLVEKCNRQIWQCTETPRPNEFGRGAAYRESICSTL